MVCTNKYKIDDDRGWKVFLDVPDGADFEGNGNFVLISKDASIEKLEKGESIIVSIGYDENSKSVKVVNGA